MIEQVLSSLFQEYFGNVPEVMRSFPGHASARQLFRMQGGGSHCIGVYLADVKENSTFAYFSEVFLKAGLSVPEVFVISPCGQYQLIQDLGVDTLFDVLKRSWPGSDKFPDEVYCLYQKALKELVNFQLLGGEHIDFRRCVSHQEYGAESMLCDFAAFEKEYLHRLGIAYDRAAFRQESKMFVDFLCQSAPNYFLYRDFQARNIMVHEGELGFIDFQGGRKGALQYDVVSLLYQSQAKLPSDIRASLLDYYLQCLRQKITYSEQTFKEYYYGFVCLRLYQVLATYGRQGLGENKPYFLKGIPNALTLLSEIIEKHGFPIPLHTIESVTKQIVEQKTV